MRRAIIVAALAVLVAGCSSRPHAWLTPGRALTACASTDCGPYSAALNWGPLGFPSTTGYLVSLNGSQVADVTASPYTFLGLDCGTTFTLAVQPHNGSGGTGNVFSVGYTSPPCPVVNTATAFSDTFAGASLGTGPNQWDAVDNTIGNTNTFQCDEAAQAAETGGNLVETLTSGTVTCPGPTAGNGGIASCPGGTCTATWSGAEVHARDQAFKYGTVTLTAKIAGATTANNAWPVIWLLGDFCQHPSYDVAGANPSPCSWSHTGSEEADIAEWVNGHSPVSGMDANSFTNAGGGAPCSSITTSPDASQNFHNYELDWNSTSSVFKVDGSTVCTLSGANNPASLEFPLISTMIGGTSSCGSCHTLVHNFSITPAGPDITTSANWPSISGSTVHGSVLTASNGTWTGSPSGFAYQWLQCNGSGSFCSPITTGSCSATWAACGSTYTTTSGDIGHEIQVLVTATNAAGATQYGSQPTGAVS